MTLPEAFQERMQAMLGEEYEEFLASYNLPRQYGLRVNTRKISPEDFARLAPFPLERIPWVPNGFFYGEGVFPARHPYYAAGLYYLQEPSAMVPASRLPVEAGDRVLDLCAAPGGKATELAVRAGDQGLLVANDISASRAKALLHNLELFGASHILVTNEVPARLAAAWPEYFDKILVDAPCSGEGMFRKDPDVIRSWSPDRVEYFAKQQRSILKSAVALLRPGGMLLYSTCTFSPQEDEGSISWLLEEYPDMELVPLERPEGFSQGRPEWGNGDPALEGCLRIWPHKMKGEGHFAALLQKAEDRTVRNGTAEEAKEEGQLGRPEEKERKAGKFGRPGEKERKAGKLGSAGKNRRKAGKSGRPGEGEGGLTAEERDLLENFLREGGAHLDLERVESRGGKAYLMPRLPQVSGGLHFLRCGLLLGEFKKGRFEPAEAYAMHLAPSSYRETLHLDPESQEVEEYLRGNPVRTIPAGEKIPNGWKLVCAGQFPLGWGKMSNGVLKNKYLTSWRKK